MSDAADALAPYDVVLLGSFGGPEAPDEVMPFLRRVTAGRGIPDARLEAVGEHYHARGGRSPINELNRELLARLRAELDRRGIDTPVLWGNRNAEPFFADALHEALDLGATRVVTLLTSAFSCYSSCRQYREDLAAAALEGGPQLDKIRLYFNHPGFLEPVVDQVAEACRGREDARLLFVTHSIPESMNEGSGPLGGAYLAQHLDAASYVAARVAEVTGRRHDHDLVFCSRSGPPHVPWLEPDVNDHLEKLAAEGVPSVVMIPIGFVSDHMEVVYDLDTEAMATAERLGLDAVRVPTSGSDERFVALVRDLVVERAAVERGEAVERKAVGGWPACWDRCAADCCPNPRSPLPALSQLPPGVLPEVVGPSGLSA
jgi:ferrochelatase